MENLCLLGYLGKFYRVNYLDDKKTTKQLYEYVNHRTLTNYLNLLFPCDLSRHSSEKNVQEKVYKHVDIREEKKKEIHGTVMTSKVEGEKPPSVLMAQQGVKVKLQTSLEHHRPTTLPII